MICENTPSRFTGLRIDYVCECGHPSMAHGTTGCVLCDVVTVMGTATGAVEAITDRLDMLQARVEIMHAHTENLIERVYALEGGDEGELSFLEKLVNAQIDRRDAKTKAEQSADLVRAVAEAKCNCGYGGVHDPNNKGCVLHSFWLVCRKCHKPITPGQWRFGSRETGWEHMGDDCER